MAHEVTLISKCGEKWNSQSLYCCLSLSFPFQSATVMKGLIPHSFKVKAFGLHSACRPDQGAAHTPCCSSAASFHLQATAPLPAAGNWAEQRDVTSLWSKVSTDGDVHAPLPPLWNSSYSTSYRKDSLPGQWSPVASCIYSFFLP